MVGLTWAKSYLNYILRGLSVQKFFPSLTCSVSAKQAHVIQHLVIDFILLIQFRSDAQLFCAMMMKGKS